MWIRDSNKTVETEDLPRIKGVTALNVALPDDNGRKGVYLVSVHSKDEAYLGSTKLVAISDIGLVAKEGQDEVWVFANSIKTTEPLKGCLLYTSLAHHVGLIIYPVQIEPLRGNMEKIAEAVVIEYLYRERTVLAELVVQPRPQGNGQPIVAGVGAFKFVLVHIARPVTIHFAVVFFADVAIEAVDNVAAVHASG